MKPTAIVVAWTLTFSAGCSFAVVRGPGGPGDSSCTRSMVVPYGDVVVGATAIGIATAAASGSLELGLGPAIGTAVVALVFMTSAYVGRSRVYACRFAGPTTAARYEHAAATATPGITLASELTQIDMARVRAIELGKTTTTELEAWFGAPTSRTELAAGHRCARMWLWLRGVEALAVAIKSDGTACEVATAGGPPPR